MSGATTSVQRKPGQQPMPPGVLLPSGCTVIYRPRGRAREYAALAANLYRGCGHGCVYCYGPGVLRTSREKFYRAEIRSGVLRRLEKDAAKFARGGITGQVLLCFTTDPYQPLDIERRLTRTAIQILHDHGLTVQILTKGGTRALRDLDLLGPGDAFATTLTLAGDEASRRWEPHAAPPSERIRTIAMFHQEGIDTWVSLEPVIRPDDALALILRTHPFVNLYKVGKMNYHALPWDVDWAPFARDAVALLKELHKPYYLKADLAAYLEEK